MTTTHQTDQQRHEARMNQLRKRLVIDHGYLANRDDLTLTEMALVHYLNSSIELLNLGAKDE